MILAIKINTLAIFVDGRFLRRLLVISAVISYNVNEAGHTSVLVVLILIGSFSHCPNFNLITVSIDPSRAKRGASGHAPARRSYEKAGYTALPIVRYYQDL
jgi:hypothetical protein